MREPIAKALISVPVYRTEQRTDGNGYVSTYYQVPAGSSSATVELTMDVGAVLRTLGARALRSKGRTARMMSGLIQAKVVGAVTREASDNA